MAAEQAKKQEEERKRREEEVNRQRQLQLAAERKKKQLEEKSKQEEIKVNAFMIDLFPNGIKLIRFYNCTISSDVWCGR